ncbi:MAG: triose-phosphate isomerase [Candidatus Eremiobacteraeota bacterium]|nr:triose-phosphate isomerase [Candidatus Eremiobacteraeota bacterium]
MARTGWRQVVAGNWKMHKTTDEAIAFVDAFLPLLPSVPATVDIVLCPPFTALDAVCRRLRGHDRVSVGAQSMSWAQNGAFTGEISPPMLTDLGVRYVILGHSERREFFNESDGDVRRKVAAALTNGLTPIVAVGETLAEREAGVADDRVVAQTGAALDGLGTDAIAKIVLAYEPIWAIGTGRNCNAGDADAVMRAIRTSVRGLDCVPILYGGSVKSGNVREYMQQPNIDGGLVGGASLDPNDFAALLCAACEGTRDEV